MLWNTVYLERAVATLESMSSDAPAKAEPYMPPLAEASLLLARSLVRLEETNDAVTALGGQAVKVGPGPTSAAFRLRDVSAVRQWLAESLAQIEGRPAATQ